MSSHAKARVRIVLEIDVSSEWGGECSVEQVYKQSKDEVEGKLHKAMKDLGYTVLGYKTQAIFVSEEAE